LSCLHLKESLLLIRLFFNSFLLNYFLPFISLHHDFNSLTRFISLHLLQFRISHHPNLNSFQLTFLFLSLLCFLFQLELLSLFDRLVPLRLLFNQLESFLSFLLIVSFDFLLSARQQLLILLPAPLLLLLGFILSLFNLIEQLLPLLLSFLVLLHAFISFLFVV
jgi:hypothetical protein